METILVALRQGNLQSTKKLIQEGTNLNVQDEQGTTALQYSVQQGHIEIVHLLLMAGADPNIKNYLNTNTSTINANFDSMIYEIQNLGNSSALHMAIKKNNIEIVKLLLLYGADPNILDSGYCSALHWAATKGNLAAVKLLLEAQVNPNLQDLAKSTALHEAVRRSYYDIIKILLEFGADPNLQDIEGNTAYDLASADQALLDFMLLNCRHIPVGCVSH